MRILTLYAFSTENWGRPNAEVRGIMRVLKRTLDRELPELHKNSVQLRHIGRLEGISEELRQKVREAIELTKDNDRIILNVAFNYGGRTEIIDAVRRIVESGVDPDRLDKELFSQYLYTAGLPDPDLIIRTAGELRMSNFLIWQGAYAEYYATPTYWPDFDEEEIERALVKKVGVPKATAAEVVAYLRANAETLEPEILDAGVCRDESDLPVLGVARSGVCKYIITGDGDLLSLGEWSGIGIISPRTYWQKARRRKPRRK